MLEKLKNMPRGLKVNVAFGLLLIIAGIIGLISISASGIETYGPNIWNSVCIVFIVFGTLFVLFLTGTYVLGKGYEEQLKKEELRKREEAERIQKKIIQLGIDNNIDFNGMCSKRDASWNRYCTAVLNAPSPTQRPVYTRGVVEGSLADNISIMANEVKKKNYEISRERESQSRSDIEKAKAQYMQAANEVISKLKELEGSEDCVKYEEKLHNQRYSIILTGGKI